MTELERLETKHNRLNIAVDEAEKRREIDRSEAGKIKLLELKKKRLQVKDDIEELLNVKNN